MIALYGAGLGPEDLEKLVEHGLIESATLEGIGACYLLSERSAALLEKIATAARSQAASQSRRSKLKLRWNAEHLN
jgi:hypothetical protein